LIADAIYTIVRKEGLKKFIGVGFSWGLTPLKFFEMKHPGMITQLVLLDLGLPTWPPMNQATREGKLTDTGLPAGNIKCLVALTAGNAGYELNNEERPIKAVIDQVRFKGNERHKQYHYRIQCQPAGRSVGPNHCR